MPTFNFATQLVHRTQKPFSTSSIGLGAVPNLWGSSEEYALPIKVGTCFELLLLYTVDRPTQMRPEPHNVLSETEKNARFRLAHKVAENTMVELTDEEVSLLKKAITVLPTEPCCLLGDFISRPEA